jgi:hypothetical protein
MFIEGNECTCFGVCMYACVSVCLCMCACLRMHVITMNKRLAGRPAFVCARARKSFRTCVNRLVPTSPFRSDWWHDGEMASVHMQETFLRTEHSLGGKTSVYACV